MEFTKSRMRQGVLMYFMSNPDSALYVREIASILKEDPGNLSKELSMLEKEGVFSSSMRGNQKFYSLNKKYPLFSELRSIIFKTIGIEGALKNIMNETENIDLSFIYGSFAKSSENTLSDIDLMIVGIPKEDKLAEKIDDLEKKLQRQINYNVYTKKEFSDKIRKNNSFVKNILKRPKIMLKGSLNGI